MPKMAKILQEGLFESRINQIAIQQRDNRHESLFFILGSYAIMALYEKSFYYEKGIMKKTYLADDLAQYYIRIQSK